MSPLDYSKERLLITKICKLEHAESTHFLMHCNQGLHALAFAKHQQLSVGNNQLWEQATKCLKYQLYESHNPCLEMSAYVSSNNMFK